ncbi:hypothetical protein [Crassaminicella indica]|uniref:Uncharacterized protein n=1 Tax=Crassaminicella indica TaxID=2855394 RepID=A0ABX8RD20_9CLOT|nr:hypothetical protein [Crassaminicella indica]QXM06964.1 hypothetical protein KVH43_04390 [Crassaminicella indica]
MDIQPRELIKLREKRKNERQRFFNSIKELSVRISACEDEKIIEDIIEDYLQEIEESEREYKKSMRDTNVLGWMGVRSLMVPALLPVMQLFADMPETTLKHLGVLGIGIGVIGAFWETRKKYRKKEKTMNIIISCN